MSAVAMTLDEIIAEQKQKRRGGGGGGGGGGGRRNISRPVRQAGGAPRRARSAGFDLDAPSGGGGKWKHDKYFEVYGGGNGGGAGGARRRGGGFRAGGPSRAVGKESDDIVKLNLSNIAPTVVTSDLEELFADFDVLGVAVHYDEGGSHLGTADLFVSRPSANTILREFVGVVLDGKEMRFAIVDEKSGRPTIRDRVQRVGAPRGTRQGGVQKRVSGGGPRGGHKSDPGGAAKRISKLSADDLDKELEAYMGNKKA